MHYGLSIIEFVLLLTQMIDSSWRWWWMSSIVIVKYLLLMFNPLRPNGRYIGHNKKQKILAPQILHI